MDRPQKVINDVDGTGAQGHSVDTGRRRIGTLGVGGSAVLLSLASKSAVAGWGSCTGSELASGNLSKAGTANPCGCSPGFWWNMNGMALWTDPMGTLNGPYTKTKMFNTVFGVTFLSPDKRLEQCGPSANPSNTLGAAGNTAMHVIAAVLNAKYYGSRYPLYGGSPSAVITAFQNAVAGGRDAVNAFKNVLDIYASYPDLWCRGSPENNSW